MIHPDLTRLLQKYAQSHNTHTDNAHKVANAALHHLGGGLPGDTPASHNLRVSQMGGYSTRPEIGKRITGLGQSYGHDVTGDTNAGTGQYRLAAGIDELNPIHSPLPRPGLDLYNKAGGRSPFRRQLSGIKR